ncbi:MAG: HAD-IIIA family hydrolase, partial [Desulfatiglandales bacterium]|nr:HAD-IIIA family hydrolase [Desulfatiglandales bacterium]
MMRFKMDEEMAEKIKRIKLLVSDVDGVLTDGRIIYDSEGGESRFFDAQDGLGIRLLKAAGIKTIFVTAKPSKAVERRATDLLVEKVYQGIKPKTKVLEKILSNVDISKEEICYVGDDLVDLSVMKAVGFPVAVANASWEIKESANYITRKSGGRGAVREVVE